MPYSGPKGKYFKALGWVGPPPIFGRIFSVVPEANSQGGVLWCSPPTNFWGTGELTSLGGFPPNFGLNCGAIKNAEYTNGAPNGETLEGKHQEGGTQGPQEEEYNKGGGEPIDGEE